MPKLRPFQREDINFIKANGHKVLVASSQGSGKTIVAIRALVESYEKCLPALIVCPASVVTNWTREIAIWGSGFPSHAIRDTKTPIPFQYDPIFYVISWDLLRLRWHEFRKKIRCVVGDEVHFSRYEEAQRTQAFVQVCSFAKRKLLLSVEGRAPVTLREDREKVIVCSLQEAVELLGVAGAGSVILPPGSRRYEVWSFDQTTQRMGWAEIYGAQAHRSPEPIIHVQTQGGLGIKVTAGHSLFRRNGGKVECPEARDLKPGDLLYVPASFEPGGRPQEFIDGRNLGLPSGTGLVKVRNVTQLPPSDELFYDLAVTENESFIAGGVACHNSGTPVIADQKDLQVLHHILESPNPPMIRRLLEDVAPDIPPKKRAYLYVQMRKKDADRYDKANRDFEEWLRKEKERLLGEGLAERQVVRAMASEALVKVGYLRRICGEAKVRAAADWICRATRLGEPVVVFAEHQGVIRKLKKELRILRVRFGVVDGITSLKKRQQAIDDFQANKIAVLIGSKAAKEGITLTAARHLLFIERFFTSAEEEQAEDRCHRIGQRYPTMIWYLHVPGTVDDRVDQIVKQKRSVVRQTIGSIPIEEAPQDNVAQLIELWGASTGIELPEGTNLGLGARRTPLPRVHIIHSVLFSGPRWTQESAHRWCRMHGFEARGSLTHKNALQMLVHKTSWFHPGSFRSVAVANDVKLVVGKRRKFEEKKKLIAAEKHIEG